MKHLNQFDVAQFRGIRNLTLGELGQINLLIGNNNSGKTSVLEALSIYADPLNWRKWYNAASNREVSSGLSLAGSASRLSFVDRWVWLFPQHREDISAATPKESNIVLKSAGQIPLKSVEASYEKFQTIEQLKQQGTKLLENGEIEVEHIEVNVTVTLATGEPIKDRWTFSENSFVPPRTEKRAPVLAAQSITPFSHRLSNLQPQIWTRVVEAELKAPTLELLRSYDAEIQDVDLLSPDARQSILSIKHQRLGRAPLSTFGDGLRRIFTLAAAIPQCRNGLLLIDELEAAIHTTALQRTFAWLVDACIQNNVQLFATTHSLEAIDAVIDASKGDRVDLVAYRLEERGTTRFDKGLLTRLREDLGTEIR